MAGERINNIWDMIFDRQDDYQPTMQQEVDYANYMANQPNAQPTQAPVMATQPVSDRQVVDLGRPSVVNNDIPNTVANTPGSMDAMDMMGMFPQNMATGAVDQAWESQRPKEPVKEPSFMDKASDFFGDEERMARMTIALNSMRLNPDPNIAKSMELKLDRLQKNKGLTSGIKWLRKYALSQTDPAKKQRFLDMAVMAEQNPEMAKKIVEKGMEAAHGIGAPDNKPYEPRFDSEGKEYIPVYNPSSNTVEKVYTGTTGMSDKQKITFETDEKRRAKDEERRDTESAKLFQKAEGISSRIRNYQGVLTSLDEGAVTGWVANQLPTLNANTANLESFARQLGLDVIGSVTFGALSEAEMKLAMATPIDINLPPKQLRAQVLKKLELQEKIRNELYIKAQEMSLSSGYSSWVQDESKRQIEHSKHSYFKLPDEMQQALDAKGIDYSKWQNFNLMQRKELLNQYNK